MGLVSKVLPLAELMPFAQKQAAKLVALPAASIRATKALMKRAKTAPVDEAMAAENKLFGAMLLAPEAKEAFTAFFEKRKPDFSQFS
jgi:enoyl-CoA hydratase/carnithine racemase